MSTPVSDHTPPRHTGAHKRTPTAELQSQMQTMIDLQYEQQKQYQQSNEEPPAEIGKPSGTTSSSTKTGLSNAERGRSGSAFQEPQKIASTNYENNYPDTAGVGLGTLLFSSEGLKHPKIPRPPQPKPSSSLMTKSAQHLHLASYGAVEESSDNVNDGDLMDSPSPPSPPPPPPPPPATTTTLVQQPQQEHDFHYVNPDYHDPFLSQDIYHHQEPPKPRPRSRTARCCCSVTACLSDLFFSEAHHRSFCYGAIDGMLTGSGIVSTFCGMQLLSSESSNAVRGLVIVFSISTCFADSVCMALGHIWTTHVLATQQAREREEAVQSLRQSRADAKGQLVDMLLARGMLKIDAMSLADTLEGYPDLFASTLMGDPLFSVETTSAPAEPHAAVGHRPRGSFPSYGRLTEYDMDPEAQNVVAEARTESIFMMLGFSLFATVPSLLFAVAPAAVTDDGTDDDGVILHPSSLVITLAGIIMWCLGVWKSQFLDSNWLLFGIETLVVLLICILASYGLGALLKTIFLPDYILRVATKSVSSRQTLQQHAHENL